MAKNTRYAVSPSSLGLSCEQSMAITGPSDMGSATIRQNRNIHFMKVTTLYFWIRGLNMPRYRAKLRLFISSRAMPAGELPPVLCEPIAIEPKISISTPARLIPTPSAFLPLIGSFRNMAAKIIVKTGPREPNIELSIEVVIVMPLRKVYCGVTRPIIAAAAVRARSFPLIFSFGRNSDRAQNRAAAQTILIPNKASGEITEAFAMSLQNTMLSPNMI